MTDAIELEGEVWRLNSGDHISRVHARQTCISDTCVLHSPTGHHMRDWTLIWRNDRAIFERICEHGVGHPDPDQRSYWTMTGQGDMGVHGCDGCCTTPPQEPDDEVDEWGVTNSECYCSIGTSDNTDIDICEYHLIAWKDELVTKLKNRWETT